MRTLHIIGFRNDGSCDFIAKPTDPIPDVIKQAAELAASKDLGSFIRAEVFDSEGGRVRIIFGSTQTKTETYHQEKKEMKKSKFSIIPLIAFIGLLFSQSAQAQYAMQSLSLGTNGVAVYGQTANDIEVAAVADLRNQRGMTVLISGYNAVAQAGALGVYFVRSLDGVTYENKQVVGALVPFTATAGAQSIYVTNLFGEMNYAGYWKLSYITNNGATADGSILTNVTVNYVINRDVRAP